MIIVLGNLKNYLEVDTKAYRVVDICGELWAVSHYFIFPFRSTTRIKTTSLFSCYHFESGRIVSNTLGKTSEESISKLKERLKGVDVSQLKNQLPSYKLNRYKSKRSNAAKP